MERYPEGSRAQLGSPEGAAPAAGDRGVRRGRRQWLAVLAGVVVAGGLGAGLAAQAVRSRGPGGSGGSGGSGGAANPGNSPVNALVSTSVVTRRSLTSQTTVSATLGYAESFIVTGKASGTITWLPAVGQVIRQGQVLYKVDNGTPVVLLYGTVPGWRTLSERMTGEDVSQLNHDLVALGYANSADIASLGWNYFSWETKYGLQQLQYALGIGNPSGTLPLGQVVFEPVALRVSTIGAQLGDPGQGPVLTATSTTPVVNIALDPSLQTQVKRGAKVTVTLPDGIVVPGTVSSVGTVATWSPSPGSSGNGNADSSSGSATIPVQVALPDPKATAWLDQAPATVHITVGSVSDALVVPVTALIAQAGGGYAVEEVTASGQRRLLPVSPGLFDDVDGLVQVTGLELAAGQHVVVPSS